MTTPHIIVESKSGYYQALSYLCRDLFINDLRPSLGLTWEHDDRQRLLLVRKGGRVPFTMVHVKCPTRTARTSHCPFVYGLAEVYQGRWTNLTDLRGFRLRECEKCWNTWTSNRFCLSRKASDLVPLWKSGLFRRYNTMGSNVVGLRRGLSATTITMVVIVNLGFLFLVVAFSGQYWLAGTLQDSSTSTTSEMHSGLWRTCVTTTNEAEDTKDSSCYPTEDYVEDGEVLSVYYNLDQMGNIRNPSKEFW